MNFLKSICTPSLTGNSRQLFRWCSRGRYPLDAQRLLGLRHDLPRPPLANHRHLWGSQWHSPRNSRFDSSLPKKPRFPVVRKLLLRIIDHEW